MIEFDIDWRKTANVPLLPERATLPNVAQPGRAGMIEVDIDWGKTANVPPLPRRATCDEANLDSSVLMLVSRGELSLHSLLLESKSTSSPL